MKKLSVLAAATIVLLMNTSAQAGDPVTLNITGNVIASPCQVSSDSITKSVDLGQNIRGVIAANRRCGHRLGQF